jgi:hypothetical protein
VVEVDQANSPLVKKEIILQKLLIHVPIEDFPSNVLVHCLSNATPNLSVPFLLEKGVDAFAESHFEEEKYNVQLLNDMSVAVCVPDQYASRFCHYIRRLR